MNTKDVILVVAGVAVGYLLAGYLKKSKDNSQTGTTTTSTGAVASAPDQAKFDKCNKEVSDFMATARFSADVLEIKKKEMFDACIARNS